LTQFPDEPAKLRTRHVAVGARYLEHWEIGISWYWTRVSVTGPRIQFAPDGVVRRIYGIRGVISCNLSVAYDRLIDVQLSGRKCEAYL
jgi:hypothetical protein